MAIYFLNLKTLGRATGSSAVSAAAYRAGERIKDERTGRTYDHSGRRDVLHKEIMLPNQFAAEKMAWAKDRSNLWNTAEGAEVRSDARTAREYLVALPAELSPQARINLVRGFSRELVERYRFALDIAIHAPRDYPGSDPRNFHAHLLATTREVTPTGLGAKTALEWSDTNRRKIGLGRAVGELLYVRERWAMAANAALEHEHVNARIDHRTLKAQGIDREPKPHIPRAAFEMERHGYHSVVAERIRAGYQARVEARLQRAAQHEPRAAAPKSPKDLTTESALKWAARYGQAHQKSPDDLAKEAALRWKARYGQAHEKSPDDLAKEAAMRWLRYRQAQLQEQAKGKAPAKELVPERAREHEREQTGPAPGSAKRSRDYDLSRDYDGPSL
jgi:ATP-dependent exoDNAse (exonuclease V) alpha subunit